LQLLCYIKVDVYTFIVTYLTSRPTRLGTCCEFALLFSVFFILMIDLDVCFLTKNVAKGCLFGSRTLWWWDEISEEIG